MVGWNGTHETGDRRTISSKHNHNNNDNSNMLRFENVLMWTDHHYLCHISSSRAHEHGYEASEKVCVCARPSLIYVCIFAVSNKITFFRNEIVIHVVAVVLLRSRTSDSQRMVCRWCDAVQWHCRLFPLPQHIQCRLVNFLWKWFSFFFSSYYFF